MSAQLGTGPVSPLQARQLKLSWALILSLGVHALALGLFVGLSALEPPKLEPPKQKPVSARLVRLGVKRDPKLLPRKPAAPPPPPPKAVEVPGARPAPPSPSKPAPARPANTQKSAAAANAQRNRSRLFDAFAKTAAAHADEPTGDPDGDPDGDSDTAEEGERYFGLILAKARRNYGVTKTIPPEELVRLKATVVLYIGPTGELIRDPQIQVSSGNDQFDQDVLLSLRKAAPFGPPPRDLVDVLRSVGIAIEARP